MDRKVTPQEFQLAQCGNPNAKLKALRTPAENRAQVAQRLGVSEATVSYWRKLFSQKGVKQPEFQRGRKKVDLQVDQLNKIAEAVQ